MGKSVKLTDGSYIDSAGVWSNAEGKSLENVLAGETYDIDSIITAAGYQSASSTLAKVGKIVTLCFGILSTSEIAAKSTLITLPAGYRPARTQAVSLRGIYTETHCGCFIYEDGRIYTAQSIPADTWIQVNIAYQTP